MPEIDDEHLLVVCNHARRISRDRNKFAEACKNLTYFPVQKLEAITTLVGQKKGETKEEVDLCTARQKKPNANAANPASAVSGDWFQDFEIPPTQEEDEENDELLASAKKSQPVLPRMDKNFYADWFVIVLIFKAECVSKKKWWGSCK